ncbi:Soluble pyridine nucleotide transhydrogenase [Streptomyces alboniger]
MRSVTAMAENDPLRRSGKGRPCGRGLRTFSGPIARTPRRRGTPNVRSAAVRCWIMPVILGRAASQVNRVVTAAVPPPAPAALPRAGSGMRHPRAPRAPAWRMIVAQSHPCIAQRGPPHGRPLRRRRARRRTRRLRGRHSRRPAGQAGSGRRGEVLRGGVCLNVGCIPTKALLRNAELAHLFTHERKTYGIKVDGQVSFDYGEAFSRSRTVADGRVKGVHFLMKKNGITEFDGRGTFLDANTLQVAKSDGTTATIGFDNCVIATGATPRLLPGTSRSERVRDVRGADPRRLAAALHRDRGTGAIGIEFAYVLHNYGVKVTIVEFLDRVAPGGRGRLQGAGQAVPQARHRRDDLDPRRVHRRIRRAGPGDRHGQGRQGAGPGGRQGPSGRRFRAERRGLRPGGDGRGAHRARRDRRRRPLPHERPAHLRHR